MDKRLINPDNYRWLRRFPWITITVLLLISMLGVIFQLLSTNPIITTALSAFDNSLAPQISALSMSILDRKSVV